MSSAQQNSAGSCFRFVVKNADAAARVIREQLGENARVLSVRNVESGGMLGLFSSPKLEVIAQLVAPEPPVAPAAPIEEPKPVLSELGAASEAVSAGRVRAPRSMIRAPKMTLPELLRRSGFSEPLLARLERSPEWRHLEELPLHRALVEVGNHLRDLAAQRTTRAPLSRAAFLGTAGVGRTTALCKWLSAEVFRRARIGHVVTAEFDRPNSPGQLPVFCEALGVPLAHFPASTEPATENAFVYFDLPGLSLRNPTENAAVARFLDAEKITERVLVLNAAYDHATLRAAYAAGREFGATHVVFTHLDEVSQWGRLWDYLLDGDLEPLFLATGPSLTSDMETDAADAVARRTMPAAEASAPRTAATADDDDHDATAPAPAAFNTAA
ncbi:MAG: flagellar GTP-binding protein [Opitutae bacterium]|nr:flagellar GTP-binding protein [Opitutae bacterium]